MLETVLEKLNKARELIEEAKELANSNNIQLHYEVRNFGFSNIELAREQKHWDSSTEQCQLDPDYSDYW